MAENVTQGGGNSRRGASRALVVIGGLILVALVGVIVALVMLLNRPEPEPEPEAPPQRTVVVNEENAEAQIEEIISQTPVEPGYYQVSMTMDWVFPDGASPSSNAFVRNRDNNSNDVYFDILLRESRETIYESPIIPLGSYIDNITLDKDLDPGVYNCIVVYHLVDENQTTLSTLNLGLTITVQN